MLLLLLLDDDDVVVVAAAAADISAGYKQTNASATFDNFEKFALHLLLFVSFFVVDKQDLSLLVVPNEIIADCFSVVCGLLPERMLHSLYLFMEF